jgi:hypothetical protein
VEELENCFLRRGARLVDTAHQAGPTEGLQPHHRSQRGIPTDWTFKYMGSWPSFKGDGGFRGEPQEISADSARHSRSVQAAVEVKAGEWKQNRGCLFHWGASNGCRTSRLCSIPKCKTILLVAGSALLSESAGVLAWAIPKERQHGSPRWWITARPTKSCFPTVLLSIPAIVRDQSEE